MDMVMVWLLIMECYCATFGVDTSPATTVFSVSFWFRIATNLTILTHEIQKMAVSSSATVDSRSTDGLVLLSQGAEARVFELPSFLGGRPAIVKERFAKSYRLPVLDAKLTKQRTVGEVRCMLRCAKVGVHAPCVYMVDMQASRIYMERIEGRSFKAFLRDHFNDATRSYTPAAHELADELGKVVARIHNAEMVHGDLTTSNVMVMGEEDGKSKAQDVSHRLVVIDFGLGFLQPLPEDKAVDLYVLERAFLSTHPNSEELVDRAMAAYARHSSSHQSKAVLKKLEDVRRRGRKRDMFG